VYSFSFIQRLEKHIWKSKFKTELPWIHKRTPSRYAVFIRNDFTI
jgi:hypothetical protein